MGFYVHHVPNTKSVHEKCISRNVHRISYISIRLEILLSDQKCDWWPRDRESRIRIWNQRLKRKLCESHYNQHCAHKIKLSDKMNQWHLTTIRKWTASQHTIQQSAKCGNTNLLWCLWIDSWTTRKIGNPYGFDGCGWLFPPPWWDLESPCSLSHKSIFGLGQTILKTLWTHTYNYTLYTYTLLMRPSSWIYLRHTV
jgi:hypothetical protein